MTFIPIMSLCGKCKTSVHFKLNEISCPDRHAVGYLVGMWRELWWCCHLWRLKYLRQPPSVTVDLWNTDASLTVTTAARFWLLHLALNKSHYEIRISLFNVFPGLIVSYSTVHIPKTKNVLCLSEDTFFFRWHHQPLIFLT